MKKFILIGSCIFLIVSVFLIESKLSEKEKAKEKEVVVTVNKNEKRAVFLSYLEYQMYFVGQSADKMKENIMMMLDECQKAGFNMIIAHVRSFSDAIYPSKIFPWSKTLTGEEGKDPGFDVLAFLIEQTHLRKMELHAWLNPYRISLSTDTSMLSSTNPAVKWLDTNHVKIISSKGIFYNPASFEVQNLIIEGIEEILNNYDVDGIHFDDYFYPDPSIDDENYNLYQKEGGTLNREEFRFDQVNQLVKKVYALVKKKDPSLLFGISPEGNIDNNYELNYADTRKWASSKEYVDYLMPQIYFGFENERKPFIETVKAWNKIVTSPTVSLMPALAFYKVGLIDNNALGGSKEWMENDDIIKKEIVVSRSLSSYKGFAVFRYDYLFNDRLKTETTMKEVENMKDLFDN